MTNDQLLKPGNDVAAAAKADEQGKMPDSTTEPLG